MPGKECWDDRKGEYSTILQAQYACDRDIDCKGVYDQGWVQPVLVVIGTLLRDKTVIGKFPINLYFNIKIYMSFSILSLNKWSWFKILISQVWKVQNLKKTVGNGNDIDNGNGIYLCSSNAVFGNSSASCIYEKIEGKSNEERF